MTHKIISSETGVTLTQMVIRNPQGGVLQTNYKISSKRTPAEPIFYDRPSAEAAYKIEVELSRKAKR